MIGKTYSQLKTDEPVLMEDENNTTLFLIFSIQNPIK